MAPCCAPPHCPRRVLTSPSPTASRRKSKSSRSSGSQRSSPTAAGTSASRPVTREKISGASAFRPPAPSPSPSARLGRCYNPAQEGATCGLPKVASCKGVSVYQGGKNGKPGTADHPSDYLGCDHGRAGLSADLLLHPLLERGRPNLPRQG